MIMIRCVPWQWSWALASLSNMLHGNYRPLTECFNLDVCFLAMPHRHTRMEDDGNCKTSAEAMQEAVPILRSYKMALFRSSQDSISNSFLSPQKNKSHISNTFSQWSSFYPSLLPHWLLLPLWSRLAPAYLA